MKLLYCTCGDCTHWEIGVQNYQHFIRCVTCGDTHTIHISMPIDGHEKLEFRTQL